MHGLVLARKDGRKVSLMVAIRGWAACVGAVAAFSLLAVAPGFATSTKPAKKRAPSVSFINGGFTPAAADQRLAAALSRGSGGSFRFTPSAAPGSRRAVTVAVRARSTARSDAQPIAAASLTTTAITPMAYNLGLSVGWKRFALSGDIAKVDSGVMPGSREAIDLGLSYSGKRWVTKLQVGTDHATGSLPLLVGGEKAYSADLSGSYSLTRNLEVTGGVRYRLQRDRLQPIEDERRDSQAVYIGTAFKF